MKTLYQHCDFADFMFKKHKTEGVRLDCWDNGLNTKLSQIWLEVGGPVYFVNAVNIKNTLQLA